MRFNSQHAGDLRRLEDPEPLGAAESDSSGDWHVLLDGHGKLFDPMEARLSEDLVMRQGTSRIHVLIATPGGCSPAIGGGLQSQGDKGGDILVAVQSPCIPVALSYMLRSRRSPQVSLTTMRVLSTTTLVPHAQGMVVILVLPVVNTMDGRGTVKQLGISKWSFHKQWSL